MEAGSSSPSKQQQQQHARLFPIPSKKVGGGDVIDDTSTAQSTMPPKNVGGGRSGIGNSAAIIDDDDTPSNKLCAVCLKELSPAAMCRGCRRLAASAFKDIHGSRRGRLVLVPHGHPFGIREEDFLEREGKSVRRWMRLFDDSAGADFFYNVYYDSSVWKDGIELPEPEPVAIATRRRRKGGGGGGGGVVINAPSSASRKKTPSGNPSTRSSSRDATSSMIVTHPPAALVAAEIRPNRSAASTPSSPQRSATASRAALRSRGDDTSRFVPEMVLDAHKRPYPAFRLVFTQIQDAAAVGGRVRGVTPAIGTARPGSRLGTGPPVSRPVSRMGTPLPAVTTT